MSNLLFAQKNKPDPKWTDCDYKVILDSTIFLGKSVFDIVSPDIREKLPTEERDALKKKYRTSKLAVNGLEARKVKLVLKKIPFHQGGTINITNSELEKYMQPICRLKNYTLKLIEITKDIYMEAFVKLRLTYEPTKSQAGL